MFELPFQQSQTLNERQNQALALAAVYQAAQLTHMIAVTGRQRLGDSGQFYLEQQIKASLNIRATDNPSLQTLSFFNSLSDISLGLKTLESSLYRPLQTATPKRLPNPLKAHKLPNAYAQALLVIERKVYSNPESVKLIEKAQQDIMKQLCFFGHDYKHSAIIARLAQAYSDTAGQINPRIMVRGNAEAFQDKEQVNRIRAALFTGLQAAHLWRQMGGSHWKLIFSRRKLLQDIRILAQLQYQTV